MAPMAEPVRWFEVLRLLTEAGNLAGQKAAFAEIHGLVARCLGRRAWADMAPDERDSLVGDCVVHFVGMYRDGHLVEATFPGLVKVHATRRHLDLARRRRRQGRAGAELDEGMLAPETGHAVDEQVDLEAELRGLRAALGELDAKHRAVLELRFGEGLTRAEIASRLGLGSGQVRTLEANGLIQLRILIASKRPGPGRIG